MSPSLQQPEHFSLRDTREQFPGWRRNGTTYDQRGADWAAIQEHQAEMWSRVEVFSTCLSPR